PTTSLAYSTPFPYTTLFRSEHLPQPLVITSRQGVGRDDDVVRADFLCERSVLDAGETMVDEHAQLRAEPLELALPVADHRHRCEDRKSTRLNSSHVKISYAV